MKTTTIVINHQFMLYFLSTESTSSTSTPFIRRHRRRSPTCRLARRSFHRVRCHRPASPCRCSTSSARRRRRHTTTTPPSNTTTRSPSSTNPLNLRPRPSRPGMRPPNRRTSCWRWQALQGPTTDRRRCHRITAACCSATSTSAPPIAIPSEQKSSAYMTDKTSELI